MARPDTDDGWIKYAHELDAALAVADFTKAERVVLREVFAQVFGPAKRKTARLSPSEVGRRVGMPRQNVARGIASLLDGGILVCLSDGIYRFVKDYESWRKGGASRLTKTEVAWVAAAPALAMSHKHGSGDSVSSNGMTHQRSWCTQPDDNLSSNGMTSCHLVGLQNPSPPNNPLVGVKTETETVDVAGIRVGHPDPPHPPAPEVADPVATLADWTDSLDPMECIGSKVRAMCAGYPVEWVRDAVLCAIVNVKEGSRASYANACLRRWKARGSPVPAEVAAAQAASPLPPPEVHRAAAPRRSRDPNRRPQGRSPSR